ncbi:hypothetical protein WISP_91905 [Willisornis vidua]|uniref:Uncharacterized protein n=1 Tax=Willisornis vidua TaxID=1566151 RepID=A0ABQ9D168_9PASS|nr:hypothetical protein WISP_91905 [Willisornis vidua]
MSVTLAQPAPGAPCFAYIEEYRTGHSTPAHLWLQLTGQNVAQQSQTINYCTVEQEATGDEALAQADRRVGKVSILGDTQSLTGHRPDQNLLLLTMSEARIGPDDLQRCLPASDILPYCDSVTVPPSYPQTPYSCSMPPDSNTSLVQTILLCPENIPYCTVRQQP